MKVLVLILGTLCLSAFVAPQSLDDRLMMTVETAIRKMEALTQKIEGKKEVVVGRRMNLFPSGFIK